MRPIALIFTLALAVTAIAGYFLIADESPNTASNTPATGETANVLDKSEREKGKQNQQRNNRETFDKTRHYIQLPRHIRGLRFGMSATEVAKKWKPAWHKKSRDIVTSVHYFDESKNVEARFEFKKEKGLQKIELRFKSDDKNQLAELYTTYRQRYEKRYGDLPHSSATWWADSYIHASIHKGRNYVSLTFRNR
ncbi:MAG: hypothetical protein KGZ25_04265 [Planctomycetes bacterium]|nr:hypothetical protein [Planctomycetota bacterium]